MATTTPTEQNATIDLKKAELYALAKDKKLSLKKYTNAMTFVVVLNDHVYTLPEITQSPDNNDVTFSWPTGQMTFVKMILGNTLYDAWKITPKPAEGKDEVPIYGVIEDRWERSAMHYLVEEKIVSSTVAMLEGVETLELSSN